MPKQRSRSRRRKGVKTRRMRSSRRKKQMIKEMPSESSMKRPSRISRFIQSGGILGRVKRKPSSQKFEQSIQPKQKPTEINPYQRNIESERKSSSVKGQRVTFTQTVPQRFLIGQPVGGSSEVKIGGEPLPPKS
jgi:hypothetical protein